MTFNLTSDIRNTLQQSYLTSQQLGLQSAINPIQKFELSVEPPEKVQEPVEVTKTETLVDKMREELKNQSQEGESTSNKDTLEHNKIEIKESPKPLFTTIDLLEVTKDNKKTKQQEHKNETFKMKTKAINSYASNLAQNNDISSSKLLLSA